MKSYDDDMGLIMVQFTDSKSQVYNISYSDIKRSLIQTLKENSPLDF